MSILAEAQALVTGDRQDDYGHPYDDFTKTAIIWTGILHPKLTDDVTPQDVALCMIGVKVSREVHKHQRDNLVDIAGYVAALGLVIEEIAMARPDRKGL